METKDEFRDKHLIIKQVIVLRKDLNMRKGKMVAQGAHASMAAILTKNHNISDNKYVEHWLRGDFTKIVVSVNSEEELKSIYAQAINSGLPCSLITDKGLTEFKGVETKTAVAIGPGPDYIINEITGDLKLL